MNTPPSRPVYTARVHRSGAFWTVDIADAEGTHVRGGSVQAPSLDEVEGSTREVVALLLDIPEDSFDLQVELRSLS